MQSLPLASRFIPLRKMWQLIKTKIENSKFKHNSPVNLLFEFTVRSKLPYNIPKSSIIRLFIRMEINKSCDKANDYLL
jgi:hypothetical protein